MEVEALQTRIEALETEVAALRATPDPRPVTPGFERLFTADIPAPAPARWDNVNYRELLVIVRNLAARVCALEMQAKQPSTTRMRD